MLSGFLLVFLSFFTYSKLQDKCKYDSLKRKLQISIGIGSTLMALGIGFFICTLGPNCNCEVNLDKWKIYLLLSSSLLCGIGLLALTLSINSELNNKECEIDLGPTILILGTIATFQILFTIIYIIYISKNNLNLIFSKKATKLQSGSQQIHTDSNINSSDLSSSDSSTDDSKMMPLKQESKVVASPKMTPLKQPSKVVYGGCMDCNEYPDRKTCEEKTGVPLCYINKQSCISSCKSKESFQKAKKARHLVNETNRSTRRALYEAKSSK
jgi:hypothetical protein